MVRNERDVRPVRTRGSRCVPSAKLGELYLCRHCAPLLWPTLSAQGWNIWPVSASALARQADEHAHADAWCDLDASA